MYYCNDFKNLTVLSLYEGEIIGQINKLYFDKKLKKLIGFEILSDEGAKYELPTNKIFRLGKNALTIRNNQAVSLKTNENSSVGCPLGSKVYSISGEYMGTIAEILLDEKFVAQKITLDSNKVLDINLVATVGKNTVVLNEQSKIINVRKFIPTLSPKLFKAKQISKASIMPVENKNPAVVPVGVASNQNNPEFLVGRLCTKDIMNFNNELLIKANSLVTKKNLKDIKRYGKLRELMLFLK